MNPIDEKVLGYLRTVHGCTAWIMSIRMKTTREEVSKSCQRLKRKGLIAASGSYWQGVKP